MRLSTSISPLYERPYRLLWIGQTVSQGGDALVRIAFVFAILAIHGTAADIGYVAAVQTVARVGFVLAGGVWADRLPRKLIMLSSDSLRAVVQTLLAVLLITHRAHVWELALGAAIYGGAQAFFGPASTGLVPETVPASQLQQANALIDMSGSFFQIAGPALSGILVAAFGPGLVFAIDAVTFIVSAVSLGLLTVAPRARAAGASFRRELAGGWHELVIRPWYWLNLIAHACWNFAMAAYLVLGPVIAARAMGGASAWGLISACWAAGAIAGGLVALRARPRRPLIVANLALVTGALPLLGLVPPLSAWAVGIAAAIGGLGLAFMSSLWASTMQQLIPAGVRSRVDSYDWLISLVVMPIGYAVVGPVAARSGDRAALVAGAMIMAVPCALVVMVPGIRAVRRTPDGGLSGPAPRQRTGESAPLGPGSRQPEPGSTLMADRAEGG